MSQEERNTTLALMDVGALFCDVVPYFPCAHAFGPQGIVPMDDELILKAVEAIQTYLNARPTAADTVEGIHYYWIDWDGEPELLAVTEAALLHLEQSGFVEHTKAGNRMVWRRRAAADGAAD